VLSAYGMTKMSVLLLDIIFVYLYSVFGV